MAFVCVVFFLSLSTLAEGRGGLRSRSAADIKMDVKAVQQEMQEALRGALGHGHGIDRNQISVANATLRPMFQSLPKNEHGRVSAAAMRYAVQRYFSKNHGWIIKGFESHSIEQQGQDDGILASKVPGFVEATLEEMLKKGGFSLPDILTVVIVVERLIFDEVARSVEFAYHLYRLGPEEMLNKEQLLTVLESHIILEMMERHGGDYDEATHMEDREEIREAYPNWDALQDFMRDVLNTEINPVLRSGAHNPFSEIGTKVFSFDDAVRIAQRIGNEYGRWGNQECMELRTFLADMDRSGTGRVPLADFYTADAGFSFQETPEYLRQLGALDESSRALGPQVIISNYAYGMSNCLSSTPYYSVCCLNECEGLLQQIEAQITTPSASPKEILDTMGRISLNSFIGNVSELSAKFQTRLEEIASRGNGKVSLHGRLFAQWLHYAFPQECPFPHAAGSLNPLTQGQRAQTDQSTFIAPEELALHTKPREVPSEVVEKEEEELWSWDEELMHAPVPPGSATTTHRSATSLWPGIIAAGILFAVKQLHTSVSASSKQRFMLPTAVKSHDI